MELSVAQARARCASARVARLATVDATARPHLVPVTFALHEDTLAIAVDHKPKRTTDLKRLRNIAANEAVSVLVDHYEEDWDRLWWVRADGTARVVPIGEPALGRLVAKYPHYAARPPGGPLILVAVTTWRGWAASR